jgi:DNA repair exonuclease SbcCD nuclease subunit
MKGIISADWHLREDKPLCRLDEDWFNTQESCIQHVISEANRRDADLYIVGDLFHRPVVSPRVVNMFLRNIKLLGGDCYLLCGNHDVQYGNYENINKSSIGVVFQSGLVKECPKEKGGLLFLHTLVFKSGNNIPPGCDAYTAKGLAEFTGDNHKAFTWCDSTSPIIINPGTLMRQTATEIDYVIGFYYVDTESETIDFVDSIDNNYDKYITRDYLKKQEERDERISAFIESLKGDNKISLNFMDNLKTYQ